MFIELRGGYIRILCPPDLFFPLDYKDTVVLSDVGSEDLVDPSLNIEDTEKKLERSRRTSKMENEAVTKQKLFKRMKSQEVVVAVKEPEQSVDASLEIVSSPILFGHRKKF